MFSRRNPSRSPSQKTAGRVSRTSSRFSPANFVPGIGPSPDKMLHGRLFAYADTHRYRLGVNHTHLPVNRPYAAEVQNYGRDSRARSGESGARISSGPPPIIIAAPIPLLTLERVERRLFTPMYRATMRAISSEEVDAARNTTN